MENKWLEDNFYGMRVDSVSADLLTSTNRVLESIPGSFWSMLNDDGKLLESISRGRSYWIFQSAVDSLELRSLYSNTASSVFHRQRWVPIKIRKSSFRRGRLGTLGLLDNKLIGRGEYKIGGSDRFKGMHTYLVHGGFAGESYGVLMNSLYKPSVVLSPGVDFLIDRDSIMLPDTIDLFGDESEFFHYYVTTEHGPDEEVTVWISCVMIDTGYLDDYFSSRIGLHHKTTPSFCRFTTEVLKAISNGMSHISLNRILASLCNIPVVISETEVVETVISDDKSSDIGDYTIITNKNVYRVPLTAKLRGSVIPGMVLHSGDLLCDTIRIYDYISSAKYPECKDQANTVTDGNTYICPSRKLNESYEFRDNFELDIPTLDLGPSSFDGYITHGLYAGRELTDLKHIEPPDKNNNPRFMFDMRGDRNDLLKFWMRVWDRFERAGVSMSTCFPEAECGNINVKLRPFDFMLCNTIGPNTIFVAIDLIDIHGDALLLEPGFLNLVSRLLCSGIDMRVIGHAQLCDQCELGQYQERVSVNASVGVSEIFYGELAQEQLVFKWVPVCS